MAKSYSWSAILKHLKAGTECACLAVFETCQYNVECFSVEGVLYFGRPNQPSSGTVSVNFTSDADVFYVAYLIPEIRKTI